MHVNHNPLPPDEITLHSFAYMSGGQQFEAGLKGDTKLIGRGRLQKGFAHKKKEEQASPEKIGF